jgi:hypothetical protein
MFARRFNPVTFSATATCQRGGAARRSLGDPSVASVACSACNRFGLRETLQDRLHARESWMEWIPGMARRGMTNEGQTDVILSETLRPYIRGELTQKAVALTWFETMKRAGKTWKASHVESQLSRCFKDHLPAIRFFFGEAAQGRAFLAALQVPEAEVERVLQIAEETLAKNGMRSTRLIVDVTAWSETIEPKKMFEAVRIAFIESPILKPATLLVTRVQYDDLPRSFDREADWLEVKCVDGAADPELLETSALVASPSEVADPERWLAMAFDSNRGALILEPPDGLALFVRHGHVNLPAVEFDLADFVTAGELPSPRESKDAVERRRWMTQLRREEEAATVDPDPRMRLAIARNLGIAATALAQDRIEHELTSIVAGLSSAPAKLSTATELETLLARAKRYPTEETVLRVGDEIHLVNPANASVSETTRLRVHRVAATVPAIRTLQAAIAGWTLGDMESDPFLHRTLGEFSTELDMLGLLHARATLSRGAARTATQGEEVTNWRETLAAIIGRDPAPAQLSVSGRGWALRSSVPSLMATALREVNKEDADVLTFAQSPFDSVVIDRAQSIGAVHEAERHHHHRTNFVLVPSPIDERAWIDALDVFVNRGGYSSGVPPVAVRPLEIQEGLWGEADEQVSYLWLALRAAISNPAVRRPDGTMLMGLGRGLGVAIRATRTAKKVSDAVIVAVRGQNRFAVTQLVDSGFRRGEYREINVAVPSTMILHREQARLQIDIVSSPLLGLVMPSAALDDDDDDSSDDD